MKMYFVLVVCPVDVFVYHTSIAQFLAFEYEVSVFVNLKKLSINTGCYCLHKCHFSNGLQSQYQMHIYDPFRRHQRISQNDFTIQ